MDRYEDDYEPQTEAQMCSDEVTRGQVCRGDDCPIWFLHPCDVWERCPNHPGESLEHPEDCR